MLTTIADALEDAFPNGVGGVVGARARLRDLGNRAGVGPARADRASARRVRGAAGRACNGPRAASSSCSYAAIAIAKSLFQKGASAASALAFQFASTNLVIELGIVMWILIGWQFTLAEFVGGLVLIVVMTMLLRLFVSKRLRSKPASTPSRPTPDINITPAGAHMGMRERLTSVSAWSDVAHNFRNDWSMLYKEITLGFLLAGFIGQLPNSFFNALFITHAPAGVKLIENAIVGPVIAVLSFVCSVGNVPLAAVLWSGGIGFAGVIAFIFADLIVVPIVVIYRKYYGTAFALRIVALMFVTMVIAALIVDGLFSAAGLIPQVRPTRGHLQPGQDRLQAVHQHSWHSHLHRAVRSHDATRRHRPRVRYEGRQGKGDSYGGGGRPSTSAATIAPSPPAARDS